MSFFEQKVGLIRIYFSLRPSASQWKLFSKILDLDGIARRSQGTNRHTHGLISYCFTGLIMYLIYSYIFLSYIILQNFYTLFFQVLDVLQYIQSFVETNTSDIKSDTTNLMSDMKDDLKSDATKQENVDDIDDDFGIKLENTDFDEAQE